jgi:DNA-binding NarL/FixJ family response regulator
VIGEDEALFSAGLRLVLEEGGFDVAAVAADGPALVSDVRQHRPDLVVTDIRMPPGQSDEGLQAAVEIRARFPAIAIVVLSQYLHRQVAITLLESPTAGTGYLLKQRITNVPAFRGDLRRVCAGDIVVDPEVVELMVTRARTQRALRDLTERQQEVLAFIAQGRSNTFIAQALSITEGAVIRHVSHIYDQLELPVSDDDHRRVLAALRFLARLLVAGPFCAVRTGAPGGQPGGDHVLAGYGRPPRVTVP